MILSRRKMKQIVFVCVGLIFGKEKNENIFFHPKSTKENIGCHWTHLTHNSKTVICMYKTFVNTEPLHGPPHILPDPQPRSVQEHNNQQFDNDNELEQTKLKIKELELKLQLLEDRIPKKYPDVTYLNYKSRKRILVCLANRRPTFSDFLQKNFSSTIFFSFAYR